MEEMNTDRTIGDACQFLGKLGFQHRSSAKFRHIYQLAEKDLIVLLPNRDVSAPLTDLDLASLWKHLVEQGHVGEQVFAAFLGERGPLKRTGTVG